MIVSFLCTRGSFETEDVQPRDGTERVGTRDEDSGDELEDYVDETEEDEYWVGKYEKTIEEKQWKKVCEDVKQTPPKP